MSTPRLLLRPSLLLVPLIVLFGAVLGALAYSEPATTASVARLVAGGKQ